ncbi:M10 family metallopeptidase C-terminal domain-containing protein [Novosphingobium sp. KCTC 2891]|uniref:calcium-binding protein n=1 Tax=Novosphingobium sp. KCTC 2891 TaxID=2989730 RepID=UPI0022232911|nr:M10 family metallopeptidase C-terminal domain-containing protein [Novosphingobium sp. KCTC 2891]MCW1383392.1 M10 family metallopeptidase C-terminal domain-containing protein [Novosphingobium sp. KCTC 2891]
MVVDIAAIQTIYGANMTYHTGNDTYVFKPDDPFFETIWDAGGKDTIDISAFSGTCLINLGEGEYSSMTFDDVALDLNLGIAYGCQIENVTGGQGADGIEGNAAANVLSGNGGDDVIGGYGGADTLSGGAGADIEAGGAGNDTFLTGADGGNDEIDGGTGADTANYSKAAAAIVVNLARQSGTGLAAGDAARIGIDHLVSVENVTGSGFADQLTGSSGANRIDGGRGNDVISGMGGNDTLIGGTGNDKLSGGAGNDVLRGGVGADAVTGGTGADRFVFDDSEFAGATASGADAIADFQRSEGDRIDLSAVDAKVATAADNAFAFIGTAAFGHVAGQLRYQVSGTNAYVFGDTNGDGLADFALRVAGVTSLAAGDFVL